MAIRLPRVLGLSLLGLYGVCWASLSGASETGPSLPLSRSPDAASVNACLKRAADTCAGAAPPAAIASTGAKGQPSPNSTAFAINGKGEFLTNYHVVKDCTGLRVRIGGEWQEARATAHDEGTDLAVIRARSAPAVPALQFRDDNGIRPADAVIVLGFPYAGLLTTDPQVTTGVVAALSGLRDDKRYLQLTAPVQPGSSGGPLVDLSGNVVGVVTAKLNKFAAAEWTGLPEWLGTLPENVNFALKSDNARAFLDANGIQYERAPSTSKRDAADIGELAAKSVIMVDCE
jgi:hypothetical protein